MNNILKLLVFSLTTLSLLAATVQPVAALGGWVDHRFRLERPDGSKMDLEGAKIHIYHDKPEGAFKDNISSFCAYPDKDSNFAKYVDEDNDPDDITDEDAKLLSDYHCLTPQSCKNTDYGAPYLPKSFDGDIAYSSWADTSYKTWHSQTFTEALKKDFPQLAKMYKPGNIRGFVNSKGETAKWKMSLDYTNGSGVAAAKQSEIDNIDNLDDGDNWGIIPGIDGRQSWKEGEVYKDPAGENALHARITWTLVPPEEDAPPLEKPTASLVGKCAHSNPGVPSYTYTLSNIDLKGANFKSSHLHFNVTKGAWTDEFKQQFGPPIYESSSVMSYSLIFTTAAPTNNTITWTVLPTEGVGNQASNTKTVADLVKWVDAKKAAGVTIPFEIKTNLESEKDGQTILNDSITVASNGFKPKFVTNECGTPPPTSPPPTGGGTIPACVSIKMLNGDGQPITNMGALLPGASVKFECGPVTGVNKYAFRLVSFDAQGKQVGDPTSIEPESSSSNRSKSINIPNEGGKFTAQCAICENNSTNCQFEIPNYNPPAPSQTTQCAPPNSCISTASCATANRVPGAVCATSGQVCCTTRPRDE